MTDKERKFKDLLEIGSKYYNDAGFCSVTAICAATGKSFGKVRWLLSKNGRKHGAGANLLQINNTLRKLGFAAVPAELPEGITTLNRAEKFLRGSKETFLIYSRQHVTCVRNGVMEDWTAGGSRIKVRHIEKIIKIN